MGESFKYRQVKEGFGHSGKEEGPAWPVGPTALKATVPVGPVGSREDLSSSPGLYSLSSFPLPLRPLFPAPWALDPVEEHQSLPS